MAFILILLMTFMYIFAVAGTVMFASYSKSERTDLKYKQSFRFENLLVRMFLLSQFYDIIFKFVIWLMGIRIFYISSKPVSNKLEP